MIISVGVTVGIVVAIVVAFVGSAPAHPGSALRLRTRQLRRRPERAHYADVEMLLEQELTVEVTREVCRLAAAREVPASLLWSWAQAHGTALLALALGAGFDRGELASTVDPAAELDQVSLEIHAELEDCLVGCLVVEAVHSAAAGEKHHHEHHRHNGTPPATALRDLRHRA